MAGINRFGGRNYYMSWQDDSAKVRNTKWDWFNARNYCRKRCMDLVSFETQQEYDWVKGFIDGKQKNKESIPISTFHARERAVLLDFWPEMQFWWLRQTRVLP